MIQPASQPLTSFIQGKFIEGLLVARHCTRCWVSLTHYQSDTKLQTTPSFLVFHS